MSFGQKITGFFERQDFARRNSWVLVVCFILPIIFMIVGFYLVTVVLIYHVSNFQRVFIEQDYSVFHPPITWIHPRVFFVVMCVILSIMGISILCKLYQLLNSGKTILARLGGKLIGDKPSNQAERRLLNVVDEMALASTMPAPAVYVLDTEMTINSFSVGYNPRRAVLGVTRGALYYLSRDELQGLVAHEFSHIANGDMRWNTFLVGILFGIEGVSDLGGTFYESGLELTNSSGLG